ncbi:hypothetical protein Hbor_39420 (plasmid) [Halogeometricum borinquense DSM 11551]|uniref:Uncharacterized protein n=3 Tax=Halogeometricum borinquense TaxID=60847 RepID=E4NW36_HALBP|nr:hypothetical protein Hbor_39420 [Halogeometricum borinquense DSM 11551]
MTKTRQGLVPTELTDQNRALDQFLRQRCPPMNLKRWKFVKNAVFAAAILGYGFTLARQGADPTIVFAGTVALLIPLLGIEYGEFAAAWAMIQGGNPPVQSRDDDQR